MASSLIAGFTEVSWASCWKIRESRLKWRWFQHYRYDRNAKSNSMDRLYRPLNCICTENICRVSRHFRWCWSECDVTSGTLAMAVIVCWQSGAGCAESKSDQMCEICLSYPTWPSRWVLCISMQWLRLKGCHVAWDEWTSGEICSLQHLWVTGSVMWAAASDESLKFGVQGASATNWFPRVDGARDNGIRLYTGHHHSSSYPFLDWGAVCVSSNGGWQLWCWE